MRVKKQNTWLAFANIINDHFIGHIVDMTLITPIIITQLFIKFNQSNFNLKVDSQTEAITGQWTVKVSVVKIMTNRTGQKEQNPTEQNLNTASELGQKSKEAIEDTAYTFLTKI